MRIRFKRKESKRVNHKWICFSLALLMIFSLVLPSASFNSVLANENDISLTDETEIMDEPRIDDTDDIGLEEVNEEIQDQGDLNEEDLIESESILDEEELLPDVNFGNGKGVVNNTFSTRAVENGFTVDTATGFITAYNGPVNNLVIPYSVGGIVVKGVSERVFSRKRLTGSITFPTNSEIKQLDDYAFSSNPGVTAIYNIPALRTGSDTITSGWGWGVFMQNTNLTQVTLSPNLIEIGDRAFAFSSLSLNHISTLLNNSRIFKVGMGAFGQRSASIGENGQLVIDSPYLEYLGVPVRPNIMSEVRLELGVFKDSSISKVIFGDSNRNLKEIGPYAFAGTSDAKSNNLNEIRFSNKMSSFNYIGSYAFCNNLELTSTNFDALDRNNELHILHGAFANTRLSPSTIVELPDNANFQGVRTGDIYYTYYDKYGVRYNENIGGAFAGCNLEDTTFLKSTWKLGVGILKNNPLITIHIPEGVDVIPEQAFMSAISTVSTVRIPESVIEIEGKAFMLNYELEKIIFSENSRLKYIGESAFQGVTGNGNGSVWPPNWETGPVLKIIAENSRGGNFPDSLEVINSKAFAGRPIGGGLVFPKSLRELLYVCFASPYRYQTNAQGLRVRKPLWPKEKRITSIEFIDRDEGDVLSFGNEILFAYQAISGVITIPATNLMFDNGTFESNDIEGVVFSRNVGAVGENPIHIGNRCFNDNKLLFFEPPIGVTGISSNAFLGQRSHGFDIVKRVNGTQALYIKRRIPDADMNKVVPVGGTWANGDPSSGIIEYDVLPSVGGTLYEYKLKNAMIDFGSSLTVNVESYNQQYEVLYKVNTNGEFTNAGSGEHEKSIVVNANDSVTEPTLHYDQTLFRMEGWYTTPNFASGTEFDFTNTQITDATTLYAKLVDNTSQVTFHAGTRGEFESIGSGVISKAVGVYPNNTAIAPDLFYDTDKYTLDGWFTSQQFQDSQRFDIENTIITGDMSLYAKYQNNVRFVVRERGELVNEGSGVQEVSLVVNDNEIVTAPNVFYDSSQYTFGGWYTSPECLESQKFEMATTPITDGMTLYAKLTTEPPEGSIVDPDDTVWAVQIPRLIKFREVSSIFNADIKLISLTGHEETTQGAFDIYTRSDNGMTMNFEQDDRYKMNYQINVEDTSIGVTEGTTQTLLTSLTNGTPVKRFTAEIVSRIPITGNYSDVLTFVVDRRN